MCERNSNENLHRPRKKKYFQYLEKNVLPKRQKMFQNETDESSDDEIVSKFVNIKRNFLFILKKLSIFIFSNFSILSERTGLTKLSYVNPQIHHYKIKVLMINIQIQKVILEIVEL